MLHAPHHHPPHIYRDNMIYFITARTVDQKSYFGTDAKKKLFCLCLKAGLQRFEIDLYAWVLLDNHYHLLLKISSGEDLSEFINFVNGKSSFELNKLENQQGRKIWYQYWDHCIRDELDFWKHFNYIHHNPVKHGFYRTQVEAFGHPFSSARQWSKIKGEEWFNSSFEFYPIIDFTTNEPESAF